MLSIDRRRAAHDHTCVIERLKLGGDIDRPMNAVRDNDAAADDDMVHVSGGRREHDRSCRVIRIVPARRGELNDTDVRSASAPTSMRPPSGHPRL